MAVIPLGYLFRPVFENEAEYSSDDEVEDTTESYKLEKEDPQPPTFSTPIGKGVSSTVYEYFYRGKKVAIKSLPKNANTEKELYLMKRCEGSPFVIELMDYFEFDGLVHIITSAYDCDIQNYNEKYPLTLKISLSIMMDVTKGLMHMHSKGVLHGDIHPGNILIKQGINCFSGCLCDLGNSLLIDEPYYNKGVRLPVISRRAPETEHGQNFSVFSDVFMLGLCLDWIFSRRPQHPTDIPELLQTLIEKCLDYRPKHRPTLSDILEVLTQVYLSID
eukprot:TRINITY_DN13781_c0_g1_i1.p1 TRINITY_DN13781_c0_g1~~TRINITY_DN13781_c0_g1_i1.p1  ORF type:complete len:275 (+),score=25.63 TRINITY_DN13781_c0_g1_i1:90-914(+)